MSFRARAIPSDGRPIYDDMLRHSSAQRRQAAAQAWQWSIECLPHSCAHRSQVSAHSLHIATASSLPRAIAPAAKVQIAAQSMSLAMQRAIAVTSGSCKQAAAQWLHAVAQA
jgi:hypothetical protein